MPKSTAPTRYSPACRLYCSSSGASNTRTATSKPCWISKYEEPPRGRCRSLQRTGKGSEEPLHDALVVGHDFSLLDRSINVRVGAFLAGGRGVRTHGSGACALMRRRRSLG